LIDSESFDAAEVGLDSIPQSDWPPILIPFFTFRIMVGCGIVMWLLAWVGSYYCVKGSIEQKRLLLWPIFLSFPLPFIAILTGWVTAEVGRQPWTIFGVLRTADALTPFLTADAATVSLIVFCSVYTFIFAFGVFYINRLLRKGPEGTLALPPAAATPNRPMSAVDEPIITSPHNVTAGE
jgi:cytochrome bd ubiquinol oxidase subunit I